MSLAGKIAKELGVESVLKVGIGYAGSNDSKVPVDTYVDYSSGARIVKKGTECKHTKPGVITWMTHAHNDAGAKISDSVAVCVKAEECETHKKMETRSQRPRKSFEAMADTRIANLRHDYPQRVRSALIRAVIESAQKERRTLSPADKIKFQLMADQMHRDLYFDRHRDLCKLMGVEAPKAGPRQGRDWRGACSKIFDENPTAMMIAMTLMHRYHVGSYSSANADPLKPLLKVYKVDSKTVASAVKREVGAKLAAIEMALKKRKAKTQH